MKFTCNIPHGIHTELKPDEIFASDSAGGTTATLYTAPSGKTGWITGLTIGISQRVTAVYYGYVSVFKSGGVLRGRWLFHGSLQSEYALHIPLNPPIKLSTGDYITIWSSHSDYIIRVTALGYET